MLQFSDGSYKIFSVNIIEQVFLTNLKVEMNIPQFFKTKSMVNFRKYKSKKKFRFRGLKMAKSNKIEKTEQLITGYQEAECLWDVLPPSQVDRNLRQMALTN